MKAMVLHKPLSPLSFEDVPEPSPQNDEIKIKVLYCGVCRTDLHIVDGELSSPKLPLILGHQVIGHVTTLGKNVKDFTVGDRVGIAWLADACGACTYCNIGKENLCDNAIFTGYQKDGGYAEYLVAKSAFAYPLPDFFSDPEAAPLLCAGLIGYRALRLTEGAKSIGFYGFGSSAHILVQVINHRKGRVYAFIREKNEKGCLFAKKMGAYWVGSTHESPPDLLDAAILFAPVGEHYPLALKSLRKGGIVVSAGIHMSDIPSFPYKLLWEERVMRSVANLTREDGREFLSLAPKIPIKTTITSYPLEQANTALDDLREGRLTGSAVLIL